MIGIAALRETVASVAWIASADGLRNTAFWIVPARVVGLGRQEGQGLGDEVHAAQVNGCEAQANSGARKPNTRWI